MLLLVNQPKPLVPTPLARPPLPPTPLHSRSTQRPLGPGGRPGGDGRGPGTTGLGRGVGPGWRQTTSRGPRRRSPAVGSRIDTGLSSFFGATSGRSDVRLCSGGGLLENGGRIGEKFAGPPASPAAARVEGGSLVRASGSRVPSNLLLPTISVSSVPILRAVARSGGRENARQGLGIPPAEVMECRGRRSACSSPPAEPHPGRRVRVMTTFAKDFDASEIPRTHIA